MKEQRLCSPPPSGSKSNMERNTGRFCQYHKESGQLIIVELYIHWFKNLYGKDIWKSLYMKMVWRGSCDALILPSSQKQIITTCNRLWFIYNHYQWSRSSGLSSKNHLCHLRREWVVDKKSTLTETFQVVKNEKWSIIDRAMITFNEQDLLDNPNPHNDVLVIAIAVSNIDVSQILVDTRSSVDILFKAAFNQLEIEVHD